MKLYLLAFTFFLACTLRAQTATDTTGLEQYCIVRVYPIIFSTQVEVIVDYGEPVKSKRRSVPAMKDETTGKTKAFNSQVDALNYFGTEGWKLVTAYPAIGTSEIHYLFKRIKKPVLTGQ